MLRSLRFASFRNLADARIEWADGLNLISGENGQGKTNLLEAVFFLAMGRSFRDARVDALPRHGEPVFVLEGETSSRQVAHRLQVKAGRGVRERSLDGRRAELGESLEVLSCLVFASPRLALFRGGPDDRRRFLDRGIIGVRPAMVAVFRDYLRALRHKNELLRKARESGAGRALRDQAAAFNLRMAAAAVRIRAARRDYVAALGGVMAAAGGPGELVPGGRPTLVYRPHPAPADGVEDSEAALAAALDARLDDEMRRGHALAGPQRDDLQVRLAGADLSRFGSAGQQRAALIALKMSKMLIQKEITGSFPILLVDDVDAELDSGRTRRALDMLAGPSQVLVASATAAAWASDPRVTRHVEVRGGIIGRSI